jgi:hypothetical protein
MSTPPPPPGSWQPHQPPGFGPPPQGPPPGYQQPWYPPPGPPNKGGGTRWLILAALVAVIAVAVAVIVVVLHSNSGGKPKESTATASDVASAGDKGPVAVVTQDPSCSAWESINKTLAASADNGWVQRDPSIPASAWTPDQRRQYEAVGQAMRNAADQTVALAKLTPHRVMRELYEQFIAYGRAYADHISQYSPQDDHLAGVANSTANGLGGICDSIAFDAAAKRGPLVPASAAPSHTSPPGDPANPQRFLTSTNPVCGDWGSTWLRFDSDTADFRGKDLTTAADQWTADQKAISQAVASKMSAWADNADQLGQRSGNPVLQDFGALTAQYYRAFVVAIPTYGTADSYLLAAGTSGGAAVWAGCQAVGG